MTAVFSKTVTEGDVHLFAGLTGDFFGVHTDESFAAGAVAVGVGGALTTGDRDTILARARQLVAAVRDLAGPPT